MKKVHSTNKQRNYSRNLKFESLEARELLAVDAGIYSTFAPTPQIGTFDTIVTSTDNPDEATSWYSLTSSNLNPSAIEQELLERINLFRSDPQGELDRIFSTASNDSLVARNSLINSALSLTSYPINSLETFLEEMRSIRSTQPLAFNTSLQTAASSHSAYMKARNDISHQCSGEDSLSARVASAGFVPGTNDDGIVSVSENIGGSFVERNGWSVASYMEAAFSVDWGVPQHTHRDAMVNPSYAEIGISVQQSNKSIGPYLVTCDFGTSTVGARVDGAYLMGVVYDDVDKDLFYDVGEGLSDVSILIERFEGSEVVGSVSLSSWGSGGYQIFLLNGSYKVTVSSDNFQQSLTKSVTINDGVNTKLDFLTSESGSFVPIVDLNGDDEGIDWGVVYKENREDPLDIFVSGRLTIIDEDSASLYGAKIYLKDRPDGASETLDVSVVGTSLTATFDNQLGLITLEGKGTLEDYENVIASLSYYNDSELCDLSTHSIGISIYDGNLWSQEAILSISIEATQLPNMTVQDLYVYEGDEGVQIVNFVVELDSPARLDVSFNFNVSSNGTALEGENFVVSKSDPISIAQGDTSAVIECYIVGNYEALKPEGLARTEDGFENPFTFFFLEIVDVENAFLTNENSLVKGTIYDDDSPIVLGLTSQYVYEDILSTDNSQRRYIFKLTPEKKGLFSWNVDSLTLPEGTSISVRESGLETEPIVVSKLTEHGGNIQWYADPSIEYWITVQSVADITSVAAKLLTITEDNVVLIDPLFDDIDSNLVQLMWEDEDNGLQLGVDSLFWNFDSDFWNTASFKTERPDVGLEFNLPSFSNNVSSFSSDDSNDLSFERGKLVTVGFQQFHFNGKDENENLTLSGSAGNDYLYYSNGKGYFQCSDGKMFVFNDVNSVSINGNGGMDRAFIEDTVSDDRLETSNDVLALYGGGYSLSAKYFTDVHVVFDQGGTDTYYATDSGEDTIVSASRNTSIISGTFVIEPAAENEESFASSARLEEEIEEVVPIEYARTVIGVEHLILMPDDYIGVATLYGDNSSSSYFDLQIGSLTTYNTRTTSTTSITRAKSIVISNIFPTLDSRLTIETPDNFQILKEGNNQTVIDEATNWSITIPIWKNVEAVTVTNAVLENIPYVYNSLFDKSNKLEQDNEFVSTEQLFSEAGYYKTSSCSEEIVSTEKESLNIRYIEEIFASWSSDGSLSSDCELLETFGIWYEPLVDNNVFLLFNLLKKKEFSDFH